MRKIIEVLSMEGTFALPHHPEDEENDFDDDGGTPLNFWYSNLLRIACKACLVSK
eukprot:gene51455-19044_t